MEVGGVLALACRGSSMQISQSPSARKEWKAVAEHSIHESGNELKHQEMERTKLSQSDEKTIYEQGKEPIDVDFCSISVDHGSSEDPLQQRLHGVSAQRGELQRMEIELRSQIIARAEIINVRSSFESQLKELSEMCRKLKEQLQEREQCICDLEIKMEEKERELHTIKIDNEKAWAKDDLLREQNKELATFRRERDNCDAERAQHLGKIHELRELLQEKERQVLELEEQHRVVQDTVLYKDGQLREAQAWVARVQEMDALQVSANHSLQGELLERTDQYNQLLLGCQRQFMEMERHIQQLQAELAEVRGRNGILNEDNTSKVNAKDSSQYVQSNGNQFDANDEGRLNADPAVMSNGNIEASPFALSGNTSTKIEHIPGVSVLPSTLFGLGTFVQPGHVPAMHPFVVHQHSVSHPLPSPNSHSTQTNMDHYQPVASLVPQQYWQNQQAIAGDSIMTKQNQFEAYRTASSLPLSVQFDYGPPAENLSASAGYLDGNHGSLHVTASSVAGSSQELQVLESNDKNYLITQQVNQSIHEISSQFHGCVNLDPAKPGRVEEKVAPEHVILQEITGSRGTDQGSTLISRDQGSCKMNHPAEERPVTEHPWVVSSAQNHSDAYIGESDGNHAIPAEQFIPVESASTSQIPAKSLDHPLFDERALLACIVRAIPAESSGPIRISTTLPNRLAKMLAPLHWHDYKKRHGRLDEFMASHPQLFVIKGDFVHLREGAQALISATTAVAKVAAAVAATTSRTASTVSVTPAAQMQRLKKASSVVTKPVIISTENSKTSASGFENLEGSYPWVGSDQKLNGMTTDMFKGIGNTNIRILSNSRDAKDQNGLFRESSSLNKAVGNGENVDRSPSNNFQSKMPSNGKYSSGVKPHGRQIAAPGSSYRR